MNMEIKSYNQFEREKKQLEDHINRLERIYAPLLYMVLIGSVLVFVNCLFTFLPKHSFSMHLFIGGYLIIFLSALWASIKDNDLEKKMIKYLPISSVDALKLATKIKTHPELEVFFCQAYRERGFISKEESTILWEALREKELVNSQSQAEQAVREKMESCH